MPSPLIRVNAKTIINMMNVSYVRCTPANEYAVCFRTGEIMTLSAADGGKEFFDFLAAEADEAKAQAVPEPAHPSDLPPPAREYGDLVSE